MRLLSPRGGNSSLSSRTKDMYGLGGDGGDGGEIGFGLVWVVLKVRVVWVARVG